MESYIGQILENNKKTKSFKELWNAFWYGFGSILDIGGARFRSKARNRLIHRKRPVTTQEAFEMDSRALEGDWMKLSEDGNKLWGRRRR